VWDVHICLVVMWDVICGVVIWDVVIWDVQYVRCCHLGCYLGGGHLGCSHVGCTVYVGLPSGMLSRGLSSGILSSDMCSFCRVVIWDVILGVVIYRILTRGV